MDIDLERMLYEQRFWARVMPEPTTGCFLWTGGFESDGYAKIKAFKSRKAISTYRLAWQLTNGSIPKGMVVCHKCDTRACVNPDHLFLGTPADNTADMVRKDRQAKGSRQGLAKLTEADIPTIRKLYSEGWSQQEIAENYMVNQTSISKVLRNETWRHV